MGSRALTLQPRPQQIERIDGRGTKGTAEGADTGGGEIAEHSVVFVTAFYARFARCDELFEVFEGCEVDGAVWEHTD